MLYRIFICTFSFMLLLNSVFGQHQNVLSLSFEKNSCRLSDNALNQLSVLSGDLKQNAFDSLVLSGHCDADGDAQYNLKLSEKRVESVYLFLVGKGIDHAKIKREFAGESAPIAGNQTPEEKMKNRRVDLSVQYAEKSQENPFRDFMQPEQYFQADAGKEIIIRGNQGTVISIPANAFETVSGEKISGQVEIELKEFYRKSDFVINSLPTESDGKILETGGTVFISAKRSGEELRLLPGKDIRLDMNYKGDFKGMQTFEGKTEAGMINWRPSRSAPFFAGYIGPVTYFEDVPFPKARKDGSGRLATSDSIFQAQIIAGNMGWINCDRFAGYRNLISTKVCVSNAPEIARVAMVFRNANSILLRFSNEGGICEFPSVPKGSRVTIFAYSDHGTEALVASKEVIIGSGQELNLSLEPVSLQKFGEVLNSLN